MIRLGLLGCADIALRRMLPAVAAAEGITLTAVASRDAATARRTAEAFGAQPVRGYAALLDRADIDAVYVPLPPALHARWVDRALRAGKHVLAEKPLTTEYGAAARLVALAGAEHLVLRENYMFPHHGQHRRVRALLDQGAIGELRSLSATFAVPPRPADDIRHREDLGGGALHDAAGYPVRLAQLLLGSALEVVGAGLRYGPGSAVDTGGSALLRRPDGVGAHLTFGMEDFYLSRYDLHGSTGRLTLRHAFTPPAGHTPVIRIEGHGGTRWLHLEPEDQVAAAVAAFVRAIRTRAGAADSEAGATSLRQAGLIAEIRRLAGARDRPGRPAGATSHHVSPSRCTPHERQERT
ncbi:Gfo/Idh/MocA family protein [Streptomyces microflavus]|uniref:Gfo/Idh/MocA family protein n=1 Tax=Streptomyces microflavus TaxID=1919 RepID=UPI00340386B4